MTRYGRLLLFVAIGLAGLVLTGAAILPSLSGPQVSAERAWGPMDDGPVILAALLAETIAPTLPTPTQTATPTQTSTRHANFLSLILQNPSPTPTLTPTPSPPPFPYADDFSDPGSGWYSASDGSRSVGYVEGAYQILLQVADDGFSVTPDLVLPADYAIAVDARQASGQDGAYGLIYGYRRVEDAYETYQFLVRPATRQHRLAKHRLDGAWVTLIEWDYHAAILEGGATNHLRVDRMGMATHLYVNEVLVATYWDDHFASPGRDAGLVAYSGETAPLDVRFDNYAASTPSLADPLFQDDFSLPGRWYTGDSDGVRSSYQSGEYEVYAQTKEWSYAVLSPLAGGMPYYAIEADMRLRNTGDRLASYGLVFGVEDWDHFYLFNVLPGRQLYALWIYSPSGYGQIVSPAQSSAINATTGTNRLKVERREDQIRLFVNGRLLRTTGNSSYRGNLPVGLYADWAELPCTVRYDNFRYSQVENRMIPTSGLSSASQLAYSPIGTSGWQIAGGGLGRALPLFAPAARDTSLHRLRLAPAPW